MTILHHVSLLTASADQTNQFYRQQLGLRLVKNTVNQENVHMRHLFYGDQLGRPGSVITFFAIDHLGPRYDQGSFLSDIDLAIPAGSAAFWQARLGGLTVKDPNDVTIRLHEQPGRLPEEAVVTASDVPAEFQLLGLLATRLVVPDPQATLTFFNQLLGLPVDQTRVPLANGGYLSVDSSQATGKHRFGRGSMDHLAVDAPSVEWLQALMVKAKDLGYVVEEYADRGWFQSVYIKEPGGNRIEFATNAPGFTLDEPLERLGQGLGLPPRFEPQREEILNYFHRKGVDFDD